MNPEFLLELRTISLLTVYSMSEVFADLAGQVGIMRAIQIINQAQTRIESARLTELALSVEGDLPS